MNLKCFVALNPYSKVNCKSCLKNVIEDHLHGQNIRMGKGNQRHVSGNQLILHVLLEPFIDGDSCFTINVAVFLNWHSAVE